MKQIVIDDQQNKRSALLTERDAKRLKRLVDKRDDHNEEIHIRLRDAPVQLASGVAYDRGLARKVTFTVGYAYYMLQFLSHEYGMDCEPVDKFSTK